MMKCPKCHYRNKKSDQFCHKCGAALTKPSSDGNADPEYSAAADAERKTQAEGLSFPDFSVSEDGLSELSTETIPVGDDGEYSSLKQQIYAAPEKNLNAEAGRDEDSHDQNAAGNLGGNLNSYDLNSPDSEPAEVAEEDPGANTAELPLGSESDVEADALHSAGVDSEQNFDVDSDSPGSVIVHDSSRYRTGKAKWIIPAAAIGILLIAGGVIFGIGQHDENAYQEAKLLAERYFEKENYDRAEEYFLKMLEYHPQEASTYTSLYKIYLEQVNEGRANHIRTNASMALDEKEWNKAERQMEKDLKVYEESATEEETDALKALYEKLLKAPDEEKDTKEPSEFDEKRGITLRAYQSVLENIYDTLSYDGQPLDASVKDKNVLRSRMSFLSADISGDGMEELVICYQDPNDPSKTLTWICSYDEPKDEVEIIDKIHGLADVYPNGYLLEYSSVQDPDFEFHPVSFYQLAEDGLGYLLEWEAWGAKPSKATDTLDADTDENGEIVAIQMEDGTMTYMDDSVFDAWLANQTKQSFVYKAEDLQSFDWDNIRQVSRAVED